MFVKNHLKVQHQKSARKGETGTQIGNKTTYADKNNFYYGFIHRNFTSNVPDHINTSSVFINYSHSRTELGRVSDNVE